MFIAVNIIVAFISTATAFNNNYPHPFHHHHHHHQRIHQRHNTHLYQSPITPTPPPPPHHKKYYPLSVPYFELYLKKRNALYEYYNTLIPHQQMPKQQQPTTPPTIPKQQQNYTNHIDKYKRMLHESLRYIFRNDDEDYDDDEDEDYEEGDEYDEYDDDDEYDYEGDGKDEEDKRYYYDEDDENDDRDMYDDYGNSEYSIEEIRRQQKKQIYQQQMRQQQQHNTTTPKPTKRPRRNYDAERNDDAPRISSIRFWGVKGGIRGEQEDGGDSEGNNNRRRRGGGNNGGNKKSENFEVVDTSKYSFKDIGGYELVKEELTQCIDLLKNFDKYKNFNVRVPKGLILEGPPGTGKTLIVKGFSGEANCSFIPVSGSDFAYKYVGVGGARIKELFDLAKENVPCVIFIDEIDAVGRKRSGDGEASSSERDSTLNQLLVQLDGYESASGVFVIGATNRVDLLDSALVRPGRMDKKMYIGMPDDNTRREILKIHLQGKPYDEKHIHLDDLVNQSDGFTGAQIENWLNEAMLYAIRHNRDRINADDLEQIINRILSGWQPIAHTFTDEMLEQIAVHEIGHALVGLLCVHHANVSKVSLNLHSPTSPGFTLFQTQVNPIHSREALFEHLVILLAGRVAEEIVYGLSVTSGASDDFSKTLRYANDMVTRYGMGETHVIIPSLENMSEKYKEIIDNDIVKLIDRAYSTARFILDKNKEMMMDLAKMLIDKKTLYVADFDEYIKNRANPLLPQPQHNNGHQPQHKIKR